jgi:hypothetical protein
MSESVATAAPKRIWFKDFGYYTMAFVIWAQRGDIPRLREG